MVFVLAAQPESVFPVYLSLLFAVVAAVAASL